MLRAFKPVELRVLRAAFPEFTNSEKINSVNGYDALTRHRILVIILHLRRPLHFAGFDAK
ncbi:MAG: hypothetical protein RLZZ536_2519 [Planctomycetota bacterium]